MIRRSFASVVCALSVASCFSLDGFTGGGDAGAQDAARDATISPADAGDDATPAGDAGSCPSSRGPSMVRVTAAGGASFCIDATEVTQSQYDLFLTSATKPPEVCSFKTSHAPRTANNGCAPSSYAPSMTPNLPVVCVDGCDAFQYCAWAGKHLCGAIGGTAGVGFPGYLGATDEWSAACSANGTRTYPYGSAYGPGTCADGMTAENVGTHPACVGGSPGLFDMSGNVAEWEDACQGTSGSSSCHIRGGSFASLADADFACAAGRSSVIGYATNDVGFRCCAY